MAVDTSTQQQLDRELCQAVNSDMAGYAADALKRGANPNAVDENEQVPVLFLAHARQFSGERSEMIELLLNNGADPQARDNKGNTVMHLAAQVGADGAVVQMLEAGVDPLTTNNAGLTPRQSVTNYSQHQAAGRLRFAEERPRIQLDEFLSRGSLFNDDPFYTSPLENCLTWKEFGAIVEKLEENGSPPITKADMMRPDVTGTPYLARAIACYQADAVLGYLAKRGEPLTAEDLAADENGKNLVADALMRREKLRPFFTPEYWKDRSAEEMTRCYRNLSPEVQEHLGNLYQLVTRKSLEDSSKQIVRGR